MTRGCKMAAANDGEICCRKTFRTTIIYSVASTPDFQMRKAHHRSKSIEDLTKGTKAHQTDTKQQQSKPVFSLFSYNNVTENSPYMGEPLIDGRLTVSHKK